MHTEISEYIPTHDKKKIFNLTPAEDQVSLVAIQARLHALRDRNLSYGARCLFAFLLDQSLNPYVNVAKGVITISATRIAENLGCYENTIFRWLESLELSRHIWKDKQFMPNFWAMNRYHISAFDPPDSPSQLPTRDGMWGNGVRRPEAPKGGQFAPPLSKTTAQNPVEILQSVGNERRGNSETTADASQKPLPGAVEKPLPGAVEKPLPGAVEKPLPGAVEKPRRTARGNHGAALAETTDIRESQLQTKRGFLSPENSSKGLKPAGVGRETQFCERMADEIRKLSGPKKAVFDYKEFGPQWRMSYREDADRAERAFTDVAAGVKEGEVRDFGATWRLRFKEFASRKAVGK